MTIYQCWDCGKDVSYEGDEVTELMLGAGCAKAICDECSLKMSDPEEIADTHLVTGKRLIAALEVFDEIKEICKEEASDCCYDTACQDIEELIREFEEV